MIDVAVLKIVGFGAVGLLVVGWLVTSFLAEGPARFRVARLASIALYLALLCLFTNLVQNAWADETHALLVPFGFLWAIFLAGFFVSVVKWVGELRGGGTAGAHATH